MIKEEQKNKINILLISEYFPPEVGAGSNRAYELCAKWVKLGALVTVITGFPDYPTGIIPSEYRGLKFLREFRDGIEVIRTYTIPAPNRGFIKRVLSFFSFMISSIIQGSKAIQNPDIIIATSPPFFVGISGFIIGKIKRAPFIFEIRDLWPESIVQLGQLKNKIIIKILEKVEYFLYKNCIHIVPVADSTVKVLEKNGIDSSKITVIKNGVDLELFKPTIKNQQLSNQLSLNNKFVIGYIGTLGLSHAIHKIIETANLLKYSEEVVFLIIGDGAEKKRVINETNKLNLDNVILLNSIDKNLLPEYYSLCDVLLVPLKKIKLFEKVIPSKIFEILAMGKPIIISVEGEAKKLVEESGGGISAEPENPIDLKNKILCLFNNPDLIKELGLNGRQFVEKDFDRNVQAIKYLDLLKSIIKK